MVGVLDRILVEAGAAGVCQDLTSPVVLGDQRSVVDVPVPEPDAARGTGADDPRVVIGVRLWCDAKGGEIGDVVGNRPLVRPEDVGLQPLFGRLLHLVIKRGDDLVAARVHLRAVGRVRALPAQEVGQLLPNQEVELRGNHLGLGGLVQYDLLGLCRKEICVGVLAPQKARSVVPPHVLEDRVAPLDDRRVGGHDPRSVIELCGIGDQVVRRGRLQYASQNGGLGNRQLTEVGDSEVIVGSSGDAVALVAVEVEIQVVGDDHLLAGVARELLGQPHRLDDLLDLAIESAGRIRQQPRRRPHQLLSDRRGAPRVAGDGVPHGRQNRRRVEAGVRPECLVLGSGRGVEDDIRDVGELENPAVLGSEGRERHGARSVVQHRLLVEVEFVEDLLRIREVLAVGRIDLDGAAEGDEAQCKERAQEEEREDHGDAPTGAAARAARA